MDRSLNRSFPPKTSEPLIPTTELLEINTDNYLLSDITKGSNFLFIDVLKMFNCKNLYLVLLNLVLMLININKNKLGGAYINLSKQFYFQILLLMIV